MNEPTLKQISAELEAALSGQKFGKIFQLARLRMAIDFRLPGAAFLFISIEPTAPRIYLIKRRLRDLEKQSGTPFSFTLFLKKRLSNAILRAIRKIPGERVLLFEFASRTELGADEKYTLVIQLTGRSSNLFLLNEQGFILDKWRETFGEGQEIGGHYAPPTRDGKSENQEVREIFSQSDFQTLSESLDNFYLEQEAEKIFRTAVKAAETKIDQELKKREKLVANLDADLTNHGDAARWKRFGDLILANLADAVLIDSKVLVIDYFDEFVPTIEIEIDENDSLTAAAEKFFKRYTKARNAREEISKRRQVLESEIADLKLLKERIGHAVAEKDIDFLSEFAGRKPADSAVQKRKDKQTENFTGARKFTSSEGFEILVGKGAKDNDFLTFRIAKSLDLWLHAADYPGSHVVVRNPNRTEIPPKTLIEAAQIAAFYSHARAQTKVAVHYTPKKFIHKPKGANPGLVSLASFKTILVEPRIDL